MDYQEKEGGWFKQVAHSTIPQLSTTLAIKSSLNFCINYRLVKIPTIPIKLMHIPCTCTYAPSSIGTKNWKFTSIWLFATIINKCRVYSELNQCGQTKLMFEWTRIDSSTKTAALSTNYPSNLCEFQTPLKCTQLHACTYNTVQYYMIMVCNMSTFCRMFVHE